MGLNRTFTPPGLDAQNPTYLYGTTDNRASSSPVVVALAALLLLGAAGCGTSEGKPGSTPAPLGPHASTSDRVVAPAIVEPLGGEVRLAAQEAGRVAEVRVVEGQQVHKGDVLAMLDASQQLAALEGAKADRAEAEAALARARHGATAQELAQARAERDAARARARLSGEEAGRNARLRARDAVSQAELDRSQHQADADAASAAALEARYQNLARGTRREDVVAAAARVEAAKARLAQAEAALERRRVTSPSEATVMWSRYQPGEYYTPGGEALFLLGDTSRYQVRADVDEIDVGRVRIDGRALVRTDTGGEPVAEGRVTWVSPRMGRKNLTTESPTARADTRIREILVEVPAKEPLLPGLRVWVEVPTGGT